MLKVRMTRTTGSSNIDAIGYLEESRQLFVKFNSGKLYVYGNVPLTLYVDLKRAPSKGQFFNRHIKRGFSGKDISASNEVLLVIDSDEVQPTKPKLNPMADARWAW